ncbi:2889_t:CDS:2 [Cetraspora pellucida]|uniref:2889_t:CDS:1 n=1 Tax=Cetraspora pellucida TaxID=1433469 RepID=A0ACA9N281_9GLOM|nr:2889_t:CDS:2 [Cetraspora pellucida]
MQKGTKQNEFLHLLPVSTLFHQWSEAKAISDIKATTIAKFIYDEIIVHYGCSQELLQKAIRPLDLALSSTINAKEPPYEQQLQVYIDFITNKLQVQLKAQQNIETA